MKVSKNKAGYNTMAWDLNLGDYVAESKLVWICNFYGEGNEKIRVAIGITNRNYDNQLRNFFKGYIMTDKGLQFWGIKKLKFSEALSKALNKIAILQSKKLKKLQWT